MTQTKVEAPFVEKVHHFKNLIQNGGMQIWQRATSATTMPAGYVSTVDRWVLDDGTDGSATSEYDLLSDADRATTGHSYALELNCTGADTSIAAGDRAYIYHSIEAQNCQHLKWGSSAAETLTLSFWVKSNLTGNFSVSIKQEDNTSYYLPLSYTINSANTWEQKVIQISPTAGSTSLITSSNGVINNDNGRGLMIFFGLVWGSNYTGSYSGTPTWTSSVDHADSDITFTNFFSSTSNNLYITGVQLEVGNQATEFEHVPHHVELQRCQRYFYKIDTVAAAYIALGTYYSSDTLYAMIPFPVTMRTEPSLTSSNATNSFTFYKASAADHMDDLSISGSANSQGALVYNQSDVSGTAAHAGSLYAAQDSILEFSAEL
jgi:hypothetical protein